MKEFYLQKQKTYKISQCQISMKKQVCMPMDMMEMPTSSTILKASQMH